MASMAIITYMRMLIYITAILVQCGNGLYMLSLCRGEVMKDPDVYNFVDLQYRYFTCWTFLLQIFYSMVGLYCDFLTLRNIRNKGYELPRRLKTFKDTIFSAILFPSILLAASVFWSLFNYDRNLVLPAYVDKILTRTSNHIIHTSIVPFALWEIICQPRTVPKSHKRNLIINGIHFLTYFFVIHYTYYERGIWIYPFFKITYGTKYHPLVIAGLYVLTLVSYYIQWPLTRLIWESPDKHTKKKN